MSHAITRRAMALTLAIMAALTVGSASPAAADTFGTAYKTATSSNPADGVPIGQAQLGWQNQTGNPNWQHDQACIWNVPLAHGGHSGDTITATILWANTSGGTTSVDLTITDGDTKCSAPSASSPKGTTVHFIMHDTWFSGGCDTVYIGETGAGSVSSACA